MHVLIVDDNPMFREIVRSVVRRSYPRATLAEAGSVAAALAAAHEGCTDVAYVDIRLPDGNGLAVLERLRKTNREAVLACCSNHDYPEYGDEAMRRGADFWISKESMDAAAILSVMAEGCRRTGAVAAEVAAGRPA